MGIGKGRMEAFSDGVLAIVLTIMVLEMKVPHGTDWQALQGLWPIFTSYVLSFIYVGTYWNNHHHLLQAAPHINGSVLWANLHSLFWLSLIPFVTGWMGENHFAPIPTALYGVVLLMAALAYWILQNCLRNLAGEDSLLAKALGRDLKGKLSLLLYALAIPLALYQPFLAGLIYGSVALMWFVPDRRIERQLYR